MTRLELKGISPALAACLIVGLMLGGLLIGYEPVGGDPDRIYRPIKAELAAHLRVGKLPFWSDRFGLGVPLVAESHAGAFYPPNWALYRALDVSTAYRISMWLHSIAIAAATFLYARNLGIGTSGASLAAVAFPFCGFLTIHSSHEWAYQTVAYLPLCLLAADRYAGTGRAGWLALLAILWGIQLALGHFQVQMWTGGLALGLGVWRVIAERQPLGRLAGLVIGLIWGAAIASVQLAPTWELARLVGQTKLTPDELAFYSYPPGHWPELAIPALFRRLAGGGEAPYWFSQKTTGFEACFFIGTIPLLLAAMGAVAGGIRLTPWRVVVPLSFCLATMPRWYPQGYLFLLQAPGLGYFRCPARYTAITSFGLALLAGRGFDADISAPRFRAGVTLALAFVLAAFGWGTAWAASHQDYLALAGGWAGLAARLGLAAVTWLAAVCVIAAWKRRPAGRAWVVLVFIAIEMCGYYYAGGTTRWGWSTPLPASSPVLSRLAREPGPVRVGGVLDNLPVRAGLMTAKPYMGFPLPPPHRVLKGVQDRRIIGDKRGERWQRRYGVTHLVWDMPVNHAEETIIFRGADPALDTLAYTSSTSPPQRSWTVVKVPGVFPSARVARVARIAPDSDTLIEQLSERDRLDEAWFTPDHAPPGTTTPRASSAEILQWDGLSGVVKHNGTCHLVITRAYYSGWLAKINDGPEQPVGQADGGLIAVRLAGAGVSRVSLRFLPNGFWACAAVSLASLAIAIGSILRMAIKPPAPHAARRGLDSESNEQRQAFARG
jgi:hypothetical protein